MVLPFIIGAIEAVAGEGAAMAASRGVASFAEKIGSDAIKNKFENAVEEIAERVSKRSAANFVKNQVKEGAENFATNELTKNDDADTQRYNQGLVRGLQSTFTKRAPQLHDLHVEGAQELTKGSNASLATASGRIERFKNNLFEAGRQIKNNPEKIAKGFGKFLLNVAIGSDQGAYQAYMIVNGAQEGFQIAFGKPQLAIQQYNHEVQDIRGLGYAKGAA